MESVPVPHHCIWEQICPGPFVQAPWVKHQTCIFLECTQSWVISFYEVYKECAVLVNDGLCLPPSPFTKSCSEGIVQLLTYMQLHSTCLFNTLHSSPGTHPAPASLQNVNHSPNWWCSTSCSHKSDTYIKHTYVVHDLYLSKPYTRVKKIPIEGVPHKHFQKKSYPRTYVAVGREGELTHSAVAKATAGSTKLIRVPPWLTGWLPTCAVPSWASGKLWATVNQPSYSSSGLPWS